VKLIIIGFSGLPVMRPYPGIVIWVRRTGRGGLQKVFWAPISAARRFIRSTKAKPARHMLAMATGVVCRF
jgi:hypothetical protein